MVTAWRGRDAHALREALRMSLDDFARHVGVSRRGAARWSANPQARLRWDTQRALDRALAAAPAEARQRFHANLARPDFAPGEETPRKEVTRDETRHEGMPHGPVPREEPTRQGTRRERMPHSHMPREEHSREGMPRERVQREGLQREGLQREGLQREGLQREGLQREGLQRKGMPGEEVRGRGGREAVPWVRTLGKVLMPQSIAAAPQALFRLERAVAHARVGFQACRYEQAAGELPHLMRALAEAKADAGQRFPERLRSLASGVHQVTASLLLKVDEVSLALLAAERGVREAEDPLTQASATRVMAEALIRAGHPEQALALESNVDGVGPRELSLRGAFHLTRAVAAAHLGEATDDLARAELAKAEAIGVDGNFAWTGFGKANVSLHRAVVARLLGQPEAARDALSKVDPACLPYPERREAYFFEAGFASASTPASARC